MSSLRNDVAELIGAQIKVALKKEYDRGWKECMEYFWEKREKEEESREKT